MHINIYILALLTSFFENLSQKFIKMAPVINSRNMIISFLLYGVVAAILQHSYNYYELSIFNVTWSSITIVSAIVLGNLLYGEIITQNKIYSLIFSLLSIYFVNK